MLLFIAVRANNYFEFQFTCFESLTEKAWFMMPEDLHHKTKPVVHAVCGSISSTVATMVAQPLDVIRTRLVAQGEPKVKPRKLTVAFHMLSTYAYSWTKL